MGTQIVAHTSADTRTPFGEHGKVGWYIGPSLEHYRCWKCYFQDTMHERDVLKVDFFPEKIAFPKFSREDYLRQTAEDMLHLLNPQQPASSPLHDPLSFGPPILNAYARVADILRRAVHPPVSPPTLVPVAPPRVPSVSSDPSPTPLVSPRSALPLAPVSLPRVPVSVSTKPLPLVPAAILLHPHQTQ